MNKKNTTQSHPIVVTAAFVIIIAGIMYAQSLITEGLMSLFIGIVCVQPVRWLQSKKIPQGLSILVVLLAIFGLFFVLGGVVGASLSSFSQQAPLYEDNLKDIKDSLFKVLASYGIVPNINEVSNLLNPGKVMSFTATFLGQLGGFMGNILTIFFLVLFLLFEMDGVSVKTMATVTDKEGANSYLNEITDSIRHYLSIKTITSLLTGVLVWIALVIIGVDYAILWALIAFLLNYIPNIGSILAALPAVLFSLIQLGLGGAIWTTAVFTAVNMVVGNLVEPKMMGNGLGLSTFVIFFSLIFWGFVLGSVGMFLSVPLTMVIKIVLEHNPNTKSIAVFLGTQKEAQEILDKKSNR